MRTDTLRTSFAAGLVSMATAEAHHQTHQHSSRQTSSGSVVDSITNGTKAGLSGYQGVQNKPAFAQLAGHISWYSDYQPDTPESNNVAGVGLLWGDNTACGSTGGDRLTAFQKVSNPKIMFGFFEPDCGCPDSASMTVEDGVSSWNQYLAPLAGNTILGSPSMCKQKDESWLKDFKAAGPKADWDVTSIHINKNSLQGVKDDVDYYVKQYGKPVWVSEFACVDDQNGFTPCSDQGDIDSFMSDAVNYFHCNEDVVAYGPSNGDGLGKTWPLIGDDGNLSDTGNAYLKALQSFTSPPNACSS